MVDLSGVTQVLCFFFEFHPYNIRCNSKKKTQNGLLSDSVWTLEKEILYFIQIY